MVKNLKFFHLFIVVKISYQNAFDDILEMKKAFSTIKKQKVKTVKNWDFSMVLIKNLKIFHLFIFGKIREENVFDHILERKKAFLDYKNQKVKKVENWDFSNGFWSKI